MRKLFSVIFCLSTFAVAQPSIVVHTSTFDTQTCTATNLFNSGCVPNWISTHGNPEIFGPTSAFSVKSAKVKVGQPSAGKVEGSSIALNYNFVAGVTYRIKFASGITWNGAIPKLQWFLANGVPNNANPGLPALPAGAVPFWPAYTNWNPGGGWISGTTTNWLTPSSNFSQLVLRIEETPSSTATPMKQLGIDDVIIERIPPPPNPTFWVTDGLNLCTTNDVVKVMPFPGNTCPMHHKWEIYAANGGTSTAPTFPALPNFTYNNQFSCNNTMEIYNQGPQIGYNISTYIKTFNFTGTNGAFAKYKIRHIVTDPVTTMSSSSFQVITGLTCKNEQPTTAEAVYPNPVQGFFNIEGENLSGTSLHIYNIIGQEVQTQVLKGERNVIEVDTLPKGNYIVQVRNAEQLLLTKQIVITE